MKSAFELTKALIESGKIGHWSAAAEAFTQLTAVEMKIDSAERVSVEAMEKVAEEYKIKSR